MKTVFFSIADYVKICSSDHGIDNKISNFFSNQTLKHTKKKTLKIGYSRMNV